MSVLDRAKAHFQLQEIRALEVPEWGDSPAAPLVVFCKPVTLEQKAKLARLAKNEASGLELLVYALIELALDAGGEKLFTLADKKALMSQVDPDVVSRVAGWLLTPPDAEAIEKN